MVFFYHQDHYFHNHQGLRLEYFSLVSIMDIPAFVYVIQLLDTIKHACWKFRYAPEFTVWNTTVAFHFEKMSITFIVPKLTMKTKMLHWLHSEIIIMLTLQRQLA